MEGDCEPLTWTNPGLGAATTMSGATVSYFVLTCHSAGVSTCLCHFDQKKLPCQGFLSLVCLFSAPEGLYFIPTIPQDTHTPNTIPYTTTPHTPHTIPQHTTHHTRAPCHIPNHTSHHSYHTHIQSMCCPRAYRTPFGCLRGDRTEGAFRTDPHLL
jgi:hypothetical protein